MKGNQPAQFTNRVTVLDDVATFKVGDVWQEDVGVARRRGHVIVDHHNEFAERIVLQDLVRTAGIGVLVQGRCARIVPQELDRHIEFVRPLDAIGKGRHFLAAIDGVGPHETGNLHLDLVRR